MLIPFTSASFTNLSGLAVADGADVEVRLESNGALAALFDDRAGTTPLTNPFSADSQGRFDFYVAGDLDGYSVEVTKGAQTHTLHHQLTSAATAISFKQDVIGAVDTAVHDELRRTCWVEQFGAVGNGSTDDAADIMKPILAGFKNIHFDNKNYKIGSEIAIAANGVTLHFHDTTLSTDADITMLRFGSSAASNLQFSGCGTTGRLTLNGSGNASTANKGLVVRNHVYGNFDAVTTITDCGGGGAILQAFGRGVTYNRFGVMEITGNFNGDYFVIDSGTEPGGFCNDNSFNCIRCVENEEGSITHANLRGAINENNRFYGVSFETHTETDTLLKITVGMQNYFYGLRLDGEGTTTILDVAAGQTGNMFFGTTSDGVIVDAADASVWYGQASSMPFMRLGDMLATGTNSWDIAVQSPGAQKELHIKANWSDGIVRFPNNTEVFFGDRVGGDNAPIQIIGEDKRVSMRTLSDTAIGSGPSVRFDGQFASGGDAGVVDIYQDANGMVVEFNVASRMLHITQALSMTDGITAPAAIAGRAIIYVDAADGDLKVKFGDGATAVIAAG